MSKFLKDLKQQLAEKEKEIERLKYTVDFYKSYYISFKEKVIDELEKVKELLLKEEKRDITRNIKAKVINVYRVCDEIDNQIEKLKKGK